MSDAVAHCWHDVGMLRVRGYESHGQSRCCRCGLEAGWRLVTRPVGGHGPYFTPTTAERVWDAEPPPCAPREKPRA